MEEQSKGGQARRRGSFGSSIAARRHVRRGPASGSFKKGKNGSTSSLVGADSSHKLDDCENQLKKSSVLPEPAALADDVSAKEPAKEPSVDATNATPREKDGTDKEETDVSKTTEPLKPQPDTSRLSEAEGKARRRGSFGSAAAARRHFRTSSVRHRRSSDFSQESADAAIEAAHQDDNLK